MTNLPDSDEALGSRVERRLRASSRETGRQHLAISGAESIMSADPRGEVWEPAKRIPSSRNKEGAPWSFRRIHRADQCPGGTEDGDGGSRLIVESGPGKVVADPVQEAELQGAAYR
jgi:hypothetical protein